MRAAASTAEHEAVSKAALCGLWFIDQKYFPKNVNTWRTQPDCPIFKKLARWIDNYFSKKKNSADIPLAPQGTSFQQSVWRLLMDIPYGSTCAYSDIAKKLAGNIRPGILTRAVAGAVGRNPISLIIPCHRVIGADGSLRGYAGGIARKQALLELEGFSKLLP